MTAIPSSTASTAAPRLPAPATPAEGTACPSQPPLSLCAAYAQRRAYIASLCAALQTLTTPALHRSPAVPSCFLAATAGPTAWPAVSTLISNTTTVSPLPRVWVVAELWDRRVVGLKSDGSGRAWSCHDIHPVAEREIERLRERFGGGNVTLDRKVFEDGAARILVSDEGVWEECAMGNSENAESESDEELSALLDVDIVLWQAGGRMTLQRVKQVCLEGKGVQGGAVSVVLVPRNWRRQWRKIEKVIDQASDDMQEQVILDMVNLKRGICTLDESDRY